jgi:cellulose biosynthesis protein BcsQ
LNEVIHENDTVDCQIHKLIANESRVPLGAGAIRTRHCVQEASELLHLLPASPDMPRRERQILSSFLNGSTIHKAYQTAAIGIGQLFRSLLADFDVVLIDCPSGLTLFTESAIRAADGIVIPTLPNEISLAAIDNLRREVAEARPDRTLEELLVGTVVSKLRQRNGDHRHYQEQSLEKLLDRAAPGFRILKPYLPYCKELEATTWRDDERSRVSFLSRYGQSSRKIERLAHEFALRCGALLAHQHQ